MYAQWVDLGISNKYPVNSFQIQDGRNAVQERPRGSRTLTFPGKFEVTNRESCITGIPLRLPL